MNKCQSPESFEQQFKENTKVRDAYSKLLAHNNSKHENSSFANNIMQGYLRKRVADNKIFVRTKHPKRYFVIDFIQGTLNIFQNEKDFHQKASNFKSILFRDIKKLMLFDKDAENKFE